MPLRQGAIAVDLPADLQQAFERTVSAPRWHTYLRAAGYRENLALSLYLWNAALGQSFQFPLQVVEVALRNVISSALAAEYGPNWWDNAACREMLESERRIDIDKAAQRIQRKYGSPPHTDQIVASLMLGFWAALLKRPYNSALWHRQTSTAFPWLKPGETIRTVSASANAVQDLRNRIFHHEPLIGRDLSADFSQIMRLLGWICPNTRDWARSNASVQKVLRERPR
ncbi:Abi family protein [Azorhizobium doebereinerae]|uniref:Abi family protein n=1 Tax=Azorhizobium doebereinerae TaxID=281091 RepID=UPI000491A64B|nr:Abi family protein [Azorhizobium doebereinerae]